MRAIELLENENDVWLTQTQFNSYVTKYIQRHPSRELFQEFLNKIRHNAYGSATHTIDSFIDAFNANTYSFNHVTELFIKVIPPHVPTFLYLNILEDVYQLRVIYRAAGYKIHPITNFNESSAVGDIINIYGIQKDMQPKLNKLSNEDFASFIGEVSAGGNWISDFDENNVLAHLNSGGPRDDFKFFLNLVFETPEGSEQLLRALFKYTGLKYIDDDYPTYRVHPISNLNESYRHFRQHAGETVFVDVFSNFYRSIIYDLDTEILHKIQQATGSKKMTPDDKHILIGIMFSIGMGFQNVIDELEKHTGIKATVLKGSQRVRLHPINSLAGLDR